MAYYLSKNVQTAKSSLCQPSSYSYPSIYFVLSIEQLQKITLSGNYDNKNVNFILFTNYV